MIVLGHQNVFDEFRVIEKIDMAGQNAVIEDTTIFLGPLREESERIRTPHREVADDAAILWTGRTNQGRHRPTAVILRVSDG
jgi:hypothetical protein